MQSKVDVAEPVLLSGIFVGLLLHRLAPRMLRAAASIPAVLAVAVAAGLAAPSLEFAWYATMRGIPAARVLLSNLNSIYPARPMSLVMAICAIPVPVLLSKPLATLLPCPAPRRCQGAETPPTYVNSPSTRGK